jgi:hypothetical protein
VCHIHCWRLTASNAANNDLLGYSVSLSGDRALVGAIGVGPAAGSRGAAYVFEFDGTTWNESAKLTTTNASLSDMLGWSVSLSGDRALVSAVKESLGGGPGSAHVFDYDGTSWNEVAELSEDQTEFDSFGYSVSLSGERAVVGAWCTGEPMSRLSKSYWRRGIRV